MRNDLTQNRFYVYLLLDPRKGVLTPFYVGKGSGGRVFEHFNSSSKRKGNNHLKNRVIDKIRKEGLEIKHYIVASGLSERDALLRERQLVSHYGRRNLHEGILTNLTDGGDSLDGAGKRVVISDQTREKMRQRMTGAGSPTFGGHTEAAKKKMSESQIRIRKEGYRPPPHTEEHKRKLGERNKLLSSKPVLKLSPKAEVLERYASLTALAKILGMSKANCLAQTVKEGSMPLDGYFYRYEGSTDIQSSEIKNSTELLARRARADRNICSAKAVHRISLNGETLETYESFKAAARANKDWKYDALWAAEKNGREYKGFLWKKLPPQPE